MKEFKRFSKLLSDESGKIIKKYFRTNLTIDSKSDDSPVTIADKTAEEVMRNLIMKEFPEHGILGEEFGEHNKDAEYQWILDPIDGTKSFICGAQTFGTLIALLKNGKPVLGVINQPILNDFLIGDNEKTFLNETQVKVRECSSIDNSVMLSTDHYAFGKYQNLEKYETLCKNVKLYRNWGDCYGYFLLATGYADIMIDAIMSVWDLMALVPVIKGAGGIITDYQGNDAVKGESALAASPAIHGQLVKMLN